MGKVPHSVGREVTVEFFDVSLVPRFHGAEDVDGGDVGAGEEAIVGDFFDAAAGCGDEGGKPGQAAGAVADGGREADQSAIDDQGTFNEAAEDGEVDVAAGEDESDFLSCQVRQLPTEDGGERSSTGSFDDALFQFHQPDNGEGDFSFADFDDAVHQGTGDFERVFPHDADGQAVRQSRLGGDASAMPFRKGGSEAGGIGRLDANDFDARLQVFECRGDTRHQPAATDGDDDGVHVRHLLDYFQTERSLAGDDGQIVVAVDVSEGLLRRDFVRLRLGFPKAGSMHDNRRPRPTAVDLFYERGIRRHHDGHWNSKLGTVIGQCECVIAGTRRDDAPLLLLRIQQQQRIPCPPFLKAPRPLQKLQLAIDLAAADFGEGGGIGTGSESNAACDAVAGGDNVGEGNCGHIGILASIGRLRLPGPPKAQFLLVWYKLPI